jgi:hypothetical protein
MIYQFNFMRLFLNRWSILPLLFLLPIKMTKGQSRSDTTFISRENTPVYHAVYIEKNKKSNYYNLVTNCDFINSDSLSYLASIEHIFGEAQTTFRKNKISSTLPKQWCPLYNFKDEFYLYAPSDWGNKQNLLINDSTIIRYFMDGPYASLIDGFKMVGEDKFEILILNSFGSVNKINITMLDWKKQIAIFEDESQPESQRYQLMVGASMARNFPIIVNYSPEQKQSEFTFDKIDYKKVLGRKKW